MIDETNKVIRQKTPTKDLQASEMRYRRLFESARDGILILDAATRKITDANPFMVELLGYSRDEFLGKELWEIGLLKDEEASRAAFRELQQNGYIRYEGLPLETKAGARRELEFISNVYAEDGHQVIQCNIRDITERKQSEEALVASEATLRQSSETQSAILNALPAHICLIDAHGKILEVNATWEHFATGNNYSGNNFGVGSNYLEICTSAYGECAEGAQQAADGIRAVLSGKLNNFELEYPCHSPEEKRWFRFMIAPLKKDPSEGLVVLHMNVTERKAAEDDLIKLTGNLKLAALEHQQVLDNSLDIICQIDEAGRFIKVSAAAKTVWGYEPEELIGRMYMELVHPDDHAKTAQAAIDVMSGQSVNTFENCYQRKDGSVAYMMWSAICFNVLSVKMYASPLSCIRKPDR